MMLSISTSFFLLSHIHPFKTRLFDFIVLLLLYSFRVDSQFLIFLAFSVRFNRDLVGVNYSKILLGRPNNCYCRDALLSLYSILLLFIVCVFFTSLIDPIVPAIFVFSAIVFDRIVRKVFSRFIRLLRQGQADTKCAFVSILILIIERIQKLKSQIYQQNDRSYSQRLMSFSKAWEFYEMRVIFVVYYMNIKVLLQGYFQLLEYQNQLKNIQVGQQTAIEIQLTDDCLVNTRWKKAFDLVMTQYFITLSGNNIHRYGCKTECYLYFLSETLTLRIIIGEKFKSKILNMLIEVSISYLPKTIVSQLYIIIPIFCQFFIKLFLMHLVERSCLFLGERFAFVIFLFLTTNLSHSLVISLTNLFPRTFFK